VPVARAYASNATKQQREAKDPEILRPYQDDKKSSGFPLLSREITF